MADEVETVGLYWRFGDIVWIFLYPCLYVVARTCDRSTRANRARGDMREERCDERRFTSPLSVRACVAVWTALLVLLAITCGSSFLPLGRFNVLVNFGVAVAKALLVALFFMHLRTAPAMVRVVALAGAFMLAILVVVSLTDFAVRL